MNFIQGAIDCCYEFGEKCMDYVGSDFRPGCKLGSVDGFDD